MSAPSTYMIRKYVSLLLKVGVLAGSVFPVIAFQTLEPHSRGEVQTIDLVSSPGPKVLADTKRAFRQGDIIRIVDGSPVDLQRLLGVGGITLTKPPVTTSTPFALQKTFAPNYRIIAARSTRTGALHEFMQLGGKSGDTIAYRKWAEKEAQLASDEGNGNAPFVDDPAPPPQAWTELQQTTLKSTDEYGNVFQNTISIYRLNDINLTYDWYMVLTDPESQPNYSGCGVFGTGSCGWWNNQRVFTMSTVPQATLVDHGPLNTITSSQAGFSIGGSIGATGPGVSAGYSESWQQPSVTTTDQSDLTTGTGKWNESFQGQGVFGSTPPETSIGLFVSHQGSIFRVPEGTTAFQFTLDQPVTSEFQPHFGNPYTNTQDPSFQVNVFPPVFTASLTALAIPPGGQGSFQVTAVNPTTSNAGLGLAWGITNLPPWLTVSQSSGSGSAAITLNVAPGTPLGSVGSINLDTNPQFAAPSVEVNPLVVRVTVGQSNETGIMLAGGVNSQNVQNVADLYSPQLGAFDFETKMQSPRASQTATLLISGQLLLTGGFTGKNEGTSSAEVFDPQTAAFTATAGVMTDARVLHTASLLANGNVLLAGGVDNSGLSGSGDALATAEVYNPAAQTFAAVGQMSIARTSHTSTLLQDGTVLIAGGQQNITLAQQTNTAEIFDPQTGQFSRTAGNLISDLYDHTATRLKDGHVLIAGGYNDNSVTNVAQLYNPATKTFTAVGNLNVARLGHSATVLSDGTVLIAGGQDSKANALATAETYNPETQTFTLLSGGAACPGNPGCLSAARSFHTATAELNGPVFLAGGQIPSSGEVLGSTEIYNPTTKLFTAGPNTTPRAQHTATLLQRPASTVALTSSANPSAVGQKITLTAIVKTNDGIGPMGSVIFFDGTAQLGSASLQASGQNQATASFATSSLASGSHSLTAAYSGDVNHGKSASSVLVQSVKTQTTTTALRSSVNPSRDGQLVTFTATVSASSGSTPTGTVTFRNNGTVLGTSPLTGNTAAFGTSTLGSGSNAITATYNGNANFATSSSPVLEQNVSKLSATISFSANPNRANFGQNILLSATVTSTGGTPGGTVTFNDGTKMLQTVPLVSGLASLTLSSLSVGSHSLFATYNGDLTHAAVTSTAVIEQISAASVTIAVSSSLNPSFYGQNVVFTATVSSSSVPTGTVTFLDSSASLGTVPLTAGVATFPTNALAGGTHSIRASYNGDASHAKNVSAPLAQTVNAVPTTTSVASSVNPSKAGQTVIFTATVNGGSKTPPTGIVTIHDGQNVLGTPGLSGGIASIPVSTLSAGAHNITAAYGGSANFAASTSSILVQNVQAVKTATSTGLSSSFNPSKPGQLVQFTATVGTSSGTPTGSVLFTDGQTRLGPAVLASGQAVFSATNLALGRHSIVATYAGDAAHTGSSSDPLVQNVAGLVTPTVTLTVQPNTASAGVPVTFTVRVSYPGGPVPTGSVNVSEGSTSYGSAALVKGVGKVVTSIIPLGSHSISATYGGDGGNFYNGAESNSVSVMIQGTGEPPPATPSVAVNVALGAPANGLVPLQLTISNNGTVNAESLHLDKILLRTLAGTGEAALVSPALPVSVGNLKPGASTVLKVHLRIPSHVRKLLLTESGALRDASGQIYRFNPSQVLFP